MDGTGGKLLAVPALGALALGAGALVAGVGLLVLPFYGSYKLHQKLQRRKRAARQRRARQDTWRKLEDMQRRGTFWTIISHLAYIAHFQPDMQQVHVFTSTSTIILQNKYKQKLPTRCSALAVTKVLPQM